MGEVKRYLNCEIGLHMTVLSASALHNWKGRKDALYLAYTLPFCLQKCIFRNAIGLKKRLEAVFVIRKRLSCMERILRNRVIELVLFIYTDPFIN